MLWHPRALLGAELCQIGQSPTRFGTRLASNNSIAYRFTEAKKKQIRAKCGKQRLQ
jgi:hypothetical protein